MAQATEERNTGTDRMELEEEASSAGDNPWINVKCVFCAQVLTCSDVPKLLECLHASCAACIVSKLHELNQMDAEIVENNTVVCPKCNVHCQSSNIIDNQFVLDNGAETESNIRKDNDVKCTSCHDNAPATKWCLECAEYICQGCVEAHQRLKITKDHTIKDKEDAEPESQASASTSSPRSLFCSVHRQERLTLFCESCDQLTCRDCQLSDHRDHKYKFNHEIAALTKNQITSLLSEVSYKRVLLTSAMKVIDERQNLIVEKKKTLVKDITNLVVKLTNAINQRGKQLVLHMNHVCDSKQKTLQEKKRALEQLSDLTDHCITFVEGALSKGSDMALLYSKKVVTNHLQRIKSRRADIPNPEIPVRIHLNLDKVPDLLKVVSAIGGIVVDGRLYSSFLSSMPPTPQSVPTIPQAGNLQVSSSTHPPPPPQLHMIRGLLRFPSQQRFPPPTSQQHMQLMQQHQFYNRQLPHQSWHIPQQHQQQQQQHQHQTAAAHSVDDSSYKITLKSQPVTSTIPKMPSPSQTSKEDAETSLDKFCQDSVNDLMLTIAKLDRNGIEVLPESSKESGIVDSSTEQTSQADKDVLSLGAVKDDPNEDWCAVCLDGGELVCCDHCPKVFHVNCHLPTLVAIPEEDSTWQCLLCTDVTKPDKNLTVGDKRTVGLTSTEQRLAERIVLELYCQYDYSLPFREVVGPEMLDYHDKIKNPMALDMIRKRLDRNNPNRYTTMIDLIQDVRKIFFNAYVYNNRESPVYKFATSLEEFFEHLLEKWLPMFVSPPSTTLHLDSQVPPYDGAKKFRRILPLPE